MEITSFQVGKMSPHFSESDKTRIHFKLQQTFHFFDTIFQLTKITAAMSNTRHYSDPYCPAINRLHHGRKLNQQYVSSNQRFHFALLHLKSTFNWRLINSSKLIQKFHSRPDFFMNSKFDLFNLPLISVILSEMRFKLVWYPENWITP